MTDHIDRRELFRRATVAASALALPSWLALGFQDGRKKPDRVAALRAAEARAKASGKVVTVFVVPSAQPRMWSQGQEFGALLNHCGPHTLVDLAACEPCCATVAEVRQAFEGIEVADEPWILCLAPLGADRKLLARTVEPDFSKVAAEPVYESGADYEKLQKARTEWMRTRIVAMEAALGSTLAALREELTRAPADDAARALIDSITSLDTPADPDRAFAQGAVLHDAMAVEKDRKKRSRLVAALVAAGTKHYRTDRVPGAKWANSGGCGLAIEGEQDASPAVACGMAMTPPLSSRFLYFYTD